MLELLKKNIFLIVIVIAISGFLLFNNDDIDEKAPQLNSVSTSTEILKEEIPDQPSTVIVDVKGEVLQPGVYEIDSQFRVDDVIQLAGGFTKSADQTMVNLALKVQDEMIIVIPKTGETSTANEQNVSGNGKVRINYATKAEIEGLNGIGPSKAQAILQYREENGFFKTIDDLLLVSGIGQKTLENLKDDVQIP
ncbi:competence protein ComEA [Virgibacillus subterraneus]|uniref:Competence protein ComEA n=1 Tax=Virgibacillus subterraneus TaxID=621109 RepID=A0A1H9DVY7_9BACI|nr:helix-hairpin-helix domain-containing protein [Virgibacillus subterraneus]SEQ16928.1 competence protein ComEA [Virgibacillus subterraneus]